jgi:hypothetical protein
MQPVWGSVRGNGTIFTCTLGLLATLLVLFTPRATAQTHSVLGTTPSFNALSLNPAGPLSVTFSQPVSASGANAIKVFSNQQRGYRTGTYTGSNTPVVGFRPSRPFAPGETISLTIPAGAASATNQPNATPRVAQFIQAAPAGNGVFQRLPFLPSGGTSTIRPHAEKIALGDLDNDGDLDVVVPSYEAHLVYFCLNDGQGSFTPPTPLMPLAFSGPVQVALADVDSDGDLDALVVCQALNSIKVYVNNGRGAFTNSFSTPTGPTPDDLHLADLDADGDLDLVVANTFATTLSVRLNNGNGSFSNAPDITVRDNPRGLALGDIDGDGDLDLVVSHSVTTSTWFNNGHGQFTTPIFLGTFMGLPVEVVLADLNQDGHLDLVTGDGDGYVRIRPGSASGVFGNMTTLPSGIYYGGVGVADLDADGDLDIVRASLSVVHVLLNAGNGAFTAPVTLPLSGSTATSVATGDVDNDGDIDFLVSDYLNRRVEKFLNQGAPPLVRIAGDSLQCNASPLLLQAVTTAPALSYRWSTGATTPSISVSQPGLYAVVATFSGGLTSTASHRVVASSLALRITGDSTLCPGATLNLLGAAPTATTYLWNTGATTPALTVNQPGTYILTATGSGGCTASQRVVVRAATLAIVGSPQVCVGGTTTLMAVAPGATAYRWNTGATSAALTVGQPGVYEVTASFAGGCTRTAAVAVVRPVAVIGGDSVLCGDRGGQLTAAHPAATAYLWSTGATTATVVVTQPGTYSVMVSYAAGCQSTAQRRVRAVTALPTFSLGPDTTVCEGTTLLLRPSAAPAPGTTYRWDDGTATATRLVQAGGVYSLQVTTACETRSASRRVDFQSCITIPNVITPNGDQVNDQFRVGGVTGTWSLQLYNRWGQQVYTTLVYQNDWGQDAPAGMYYFLLQQAGSSIPHKGWLEVIR